MTEPQLRALRRKHLLELIRDLESDLQKAILDKEQLMYAYQCGHEQNQEAGYLPTQIPPQDAQPRTGSGQNDHPQPEAFAPQQDTQYSWYTQPGWEWPEPPQYAQPYPQADPPQWYAQWEIQPQDVWQPAQWPVQQQPVYPPQYARPWPFAAQAVS